MRHHIVPADGTGASIIDCAVIEQHPGDEAELAARCARRNMRRQFIADETAAEGVEEPVFASAVHRAPSERNPASFAARAK
jgi:hypothetical protein